MLTQIGTKACNAVFNPSFCNQAYGVPAGFAVLTGTVVLGFCILKRMYRPEEGASKPMSSRHVEAQEREVVLQELDSEDEEGVEQGAPKAVTFGKFIVGGPLDGYSRDLLGLAESMCKTPDSKQRFQESLIEGELNWKRLVLICRFNAGHTLSDSDKLPWDARYVGFTGHIDGIGSADLTKPVMWGRDNTGRAFLACRMLFWEKENAEDKKIAAYVIFQRYTNIENYLVGTCPLSPYSWRNKLDKIDPRFVQFLKGEVVEFEYSTLEFLENGEEKYTIMCCQLDRELNEAAQVADRRMVPVGVDPTPHPAHLYPGTISMLVIVHEEDSSKEE